MVERIYRQRLARDFSKSTGINQSRGNAIANIANRGAPILSSFLLLLFPDGTRYTGIRSNHECGITRAYFSEICLHARV